MKTNLLLAGLLAFGGLNAQYFQNTNGTGAFDRTADGVNVVAGGQGHVITGSTQVFGTQDLILTRTNVNGNSPVAAPTFNQIYRLTTPAGAVLTVEPCKVLQVASGRIVVVGTYWNNAVVPATTGIFTAIFSAAGVPFNAVGWQTTVPGPSLTINATSACRDLNAASNNIYICGFTDAIANGGYTPFVLAINGSTNVFIWGRFYNYAPIVVPSKLLPTDIIASPYLPAGVNELFMVGDYYDGTGFDEGFCLRLNVANGNPVGNATSYDSGANDKFTGVTIATGVGGGGNGFVISGDNNRSGTWDGWSLKVDPTGTGVRWSTVHDYSLGGDNFGTDVIQRQNTFGVWNYYMSGTAINGSVGGNSDMMVYFIDDNGNEVREFTYGTFGTDYSVEISSFTGTGADGITVYGQTNTAADPGQEYYVKAYYNGVSGCNEAVAPGANNVLPLARVAHQVQRLGNMGGTPLVNATIGAVPANLSFCFNVVIGTGSNARLAEQPESTTAAAQLYPNPVSAGSPVVTLNITAATAGQVQVRITDLLGREVFSQSITLTEGQSMHDIQLPSGISSGLYSLTITGASITETHRFVVE